MSDPRNSQNLLHVARGRWLARTGEGSRIRHALELSVVEVADAVGVSALTLRRWEAGETSPSPSAAARWYVVLRDLADSMNLPLMPEAS